MLNLNLRIYNQSHTKEEKKALERCFQQIQCYLQETIISKNPVRRSVEYRLEYNSYSESYLVIDCNENQVYLKHDNHGSRSDCYFIKGSKESDNKHFKYVLCAAVIDNWPIINEEVKEKFGDCRSLLELCESFNA